MFHFIFDYNYGNFFIDLDNFLYRWKQEWMLYQSV